VSDVVWPVQTMDRASVTAQAVGFLGDLLSIAGVIASLVLFLWIGLKRGQGDVPPAQA
jgi:hypothetical protein